MAGTQAGFILLAASALLGCGRTESSLLEPPTGAASGGIGVGTASGHDGSTAGENGGSTGVEHGGSTGTGDGGGSGRPVDAERVVPTPRLPENGQATGSVWSERARRPHFRWDAVAGATYELQVDDSCAPTAFQGCEFPSPEWMQLDLPEPDIVLPVSLPVSETAPVGRRYFWRVRACAAGACSPWSAIRYVDVGRQKSDFDGDGYADVVLANSGSSLSHGRVVVAFGPHPSARSLQLEEAPVPDTSDRFGTVAEPLGDLDADGFADLLITVPGDGPNAEVKTLGHALVYFGSASFGDDADRKILRVDGDADGFFSFGYTATPAGDVDGDGQQDFAVGNPSPRLYRGSSRSVVATDIPLLRTGEIVERLSAGDVTGDGHSDLLAVLWASAEKHGRADLLPGGSNGFGEAETLRQTDGSTVAPFTIASDADGDGFRDLAFVVNSGSTPDKNRIDLSFGADPPVTDTGLTWAGATVGEQGTSYAELSAPISAGDVNGDGFDDALVGAAWHDSALAQVSLYLGGAESRSTPDAVYTVEGEPLYVSTGVPKAVGDVNGDGFDDVFLTEDFSHTGTLFFGGPDLDASADDEISIRL
jgi:hypothetical protein